MIINDLQSVSGRKLHERRIYFVEKTIFLQVFQRKRTKKFKKDCFRFSSFRRHDNWSKLLYFSNGISSSKSVKYSKYLFVFQCILFFKNVISYRNVESHVSQPFVSFVSLVLKLRKKSTPETPENFHEGFYFSEKFDARKWRLIQRERERYTNSTLYNFPLSFIYSFRFELFTFRVPFNRVRMNSELDPGHKPEIPLSTRVSHGNSHKTLASTERREKDRRERV